MAATAAPLETRVRTYVNAAGCAYRAGRFADAERHVAEGLRLAADGEFASVLSSHSVEHVPDPERVVAEAVRVLAPGGVAVFITPNRLTFGRPDEIIDPFHFIEFSADELVLLLDRLWTELRRRDGFRAPHPRSAESDRPRGDGGENAE